MYRSSTIIFLLTVNCMYYILCFTQNLKPRFLNRWNSNHSQALQPPLTSLLHTKQPLLLQPQHRQLCSSSQNRHSNNCNNNRNQNKKRILRWVNSSTESTFLRQQLRPRDRSSLSTNRKFRQLLQPCGPSNKQLTTINFQSQAPQLPFKQTTMFRFQYFREIYKKYHLMESAKSWCFHLVHVIKLT